jgi:hypothetical protein
MDRSTALESYRKGYELIRESLAGIPREAWSYKPSPTSWSIHEIIIHLADSEVNGYIRCRKIIAEPGSSITAYDQDAWTDKLSYSSQNTEDHLNLFRMLRELNHRLLSGLAEPVWEHHILHPEKGKVTLNDWLTIYSNHVKVHLEQVQRAYHSWKSATNLHGAAAGH